MNNLLERFHHSYFLYALLSPDRFITVEMYLVPVVCFLLALALQVALPFPIPPKAFRCRSAFKHRQLDAGDAFAIFADCCSKCTGANERSALVHALSRRQLLLRALTRRCRSQQPHQMAAT